jgi:hypothetical protein
MTHTLIKPHHLERSAYVYLRQSSPGQVRKNREGRQRQEAMVEHVAGLGWPRSTRTPAGPAVHSTAARTYTGCWKRL